VRAVASMLPSSFLTRTRPLLPRQLSKGCGCSAVSHRRALTVPCFQFEFETQIEWNIVLTDCGGKVCRGEKRALLPLVIAIWNGAMQGPGTDPTSYDLIGNKVLPTLLAYRQLLCGLLLLPLNRIMWCCSDMGAVVRHVLCAVHDRLAVCSAADLGCSVGHAAALTDTAMAEQPCPRFPGVELHGPVFCGVVHAGP
jgi:hypothetical protein